MHISTPLILSHNLLQYPLRGNRLVVQDNLVPGHVCFNDGILVHSAVKYGFGQEIDKFTLLTLFTGRAPNAGS